MICPIHHVAFIPATDSGVKHLWLCPVSGCTEHCLQPAAKAKQSAVTPPGPTEAQLQQQGRQWGRFHGYEVIETGHIFRQATCPRCGNRFHPHTGTSDDAGIADTLWAKPEHGNVWRMVEWKRDASARIRPEQARLNALGLTAIVWNLDMLQKALE